MKRIFLLLLLLPYSFAFSQQKDLKKESDKIFQQIRNHEYSKVTARFDTSIAVRIDTARLRQVWERLLPMTGPFVKVIEVTTDTVDKNDVVIQHLQFEKRKIDFKLIFSDNGKIKGLTFLPGEKRDKYKLPEYDNPAAINERKLPVDNGPYKLPGILSNPAKAGRYPVVLMIHGAGPNDKDETVGPMKIFKDISIGLTTKDISVYRYDKRTRVYSVQSALNRKFTIYDETIEDALAAILMLKKDSTVDTNAIYLCGHSMGAMLLPRIAAQAKGIKGLIYLTPNARPLEDLMYEQTEYILSGDTSGVNSKHVLDSLKAEVAKIKSLKPGSVPDSVNILRFPPSYWIDLNAYDPVKSAQKLTIPMLFLFGERDYQITKKESDLWQEGMKNNKAEFIIYPKLNHFFISGESKSTIMEYNKSGNVDITVINDIARWIKSGTVK
jgi:dienelactone hydrolase